MKIFITVGTTPFNELIKNVDNITSEFKDYSFIFQIAKGEYLPKNGKFFDFISDIEDYYNNADIIITHAGAGSIYRLLELKKTIIVVPNMVRVDKHQSDIATYMFKHNHVLLLDDFNNTYNILEKGKNFQPTPFVKKDFFVKDDIIKFIKECI